MKVYTHDSVVKQMGQMARCHIRDLERIQHLIHNELYGDAEDYIERQLVLMAMEAYPGSEHEVEDDDHIG